MNESRNPFLSILITTYNRSFFLRQCLSSIHESLKEFLNEGTIELIALNNGSTDDTHEVLHLFEQKLPLKVLYEKDNISFVPGILKCISHAKGTYCWFLGDDDFITGGIKELVNFLKEAEPDILLLNHFFYTFEDKKITYLMKNKHKFLFKKSKPLYDSYEDYILDVRHNNAFFTHIAPIIFKKEQWDLYFSSELVQRHFESHSIHIYIFLSILKNSKKICFFQKPKVVLRVGAPPLVWLTEDGRYDRFLMDVQHFTDMFKDVFNDKRLVRHFKDIMLKKSVLVLLLGTKLRCRFSSHFYLKLLKLLYSNYKTHPFFWYSIIPVLLTPRITFSLLYKWFIKKR